MNDAANEMSGFDLAYLGDAVIEVMVRNRLIKDGCKKGEHYSDKALLYVTAKAQSDALARIEDLLNDTEKSVYLRARNNYHTSNVPKSATPAQYRRSTGFEAVFGFLYVLDDRERLKLLFDAAYPKN